MEEGVFIIFRYFVNITGIYKIIEGFTVLGEFRSFCPARRLGCRWFGEVCVGLDKCFVVLKGGCELVVEVLLAGLGLLQCFAEPLVLLSERDSHEVDGFVAGVFEVAVRDVYVAVAAREFAVGDDLMFPLSVWALYGGEVLGWNLFVEGSCEMPE